MAAHVLITGATSGIGMATAKLFGKNGHPLTLLGRRKERLDALAEAMKSAHRVRVTTIPVDIRNRTALQKEMELFPDIFNSVDILINNAGLSRGLAPLQEGMIEDWEEMIDTNVKGLLYITRLVLPAMVKRGNGHVVNLGSISGRDVYRGGAVYCATKFAVRGLNEALRLDVHGSGVRITSIDPGLVETEFSTVRFHGDAARAKEVYQGMKPLSGEDVAEAIYWATTRPAHVNVQEMLIMPTDQSAIGTVHRR